MHLEDASRTLFHFDNDLGAFTFASVIDDGVLRDGMMAFAATAAMGGSREAEPRALEFASKQQNGCRTHNG